MLQFLNKYIGLVYSMCLVVQIMWIIHNVIPSNQILNRTTYVIKKNVYDKFYVTDA